MRVRERGTTLENGREKDAKDLQDERERERERERKIDRQRDKQRET